ncbi:MAG: DUF5018 domain-containing protein [Treponema sp.]|nr:DUF5018 domain-containing protein [Treponema sp.]
MKKRTVIRSAAGAFAAALLIFGGVLSGCQQLLLEKPEPRPIPPEMGTLSVSFSETGTSSIAASARTMLAVDPDFTRYELYVSASSDGSNPAVYSSNTGSFQITLSEGSYSVSAAGYTGENITAKTWDVETKTMVITPVTISSGTQADAELTLHPYMEEEVYGTIQFSLNWAAGQIPARAELLVEQYDPAGNWTPIPISYIREPLTAGPRQGTVVILQRETGLVQQSGALSLPPGEYKLTTSVTMDGPNPPVSRADMAHVFSNLITPAAFFYSAGDLTVTSPGMDGGSGFITYFNFKETPGAVFVIGSNPGPDGTRLIMVMVPPGTGLAHLTPVVECAAGASIASPPPLPDLENGKPVWAAGDYRQPTSWTAEGRNGVTQQYTVVVTELADDACSITDIAFEETGLMGPAVIDQAAGTITVTVPYNTGTAYQNYNLTPVISWIGKDIKLLGAGDSEINYSPGTKVAFGSTPSRKFRVYAQDGTSKDYTVTIEEALNGEAEITRFFFDGYPDRPGSIDNPAPGDITVTLPYGSNLGSLKPLITYKGNLSPASGVEQNFNVPVVYTVISANGITTKTYTVTVNTEPANADTGIFDFVITNVPRAKVVIGTKPRADGKIPIIVSVPYATSPLTLDGSKTDLTKLIPRITLSSPDSKFVNSAGTEILPPNGTSDTIPFGNQNDDYQEAVYRIKAQAGNIQDYVVIVARDVHYYYVSASGNDTDPDYYHGSEQAPFKTLAYAVYQAVKHNVDHIYVIGTLNDSSEGGAWEDTSATQMGNNGISHSSGAPQTGGGASVFNLNGTGRNGSAAWPIYITGIGSNAVLQGAADKRVISITGGARIIFDNITIRGGGGTGNSYGGNGGGIYIGGGSHVTWKTGVISDNRARSGGGVYLDNSEFDFMTGSVKNNAATSGTVTRADFENNTIGAGSIQGGGGVYVYGEDGQLWLANGEIINNSAAGSGGGVLVNGAAIPDNSNPGQATYDFIMSGGSVNGNSSAGSVWPHGGGGVFVAKGSFQMMKGRIMNNTSNRQGGGVFVWSRALFYMDGDSSVTANEGVGSAKAICNRGITTMRGNAQADKVYIWNYSKGSWNNGVGDEFTLMEGARVSGLVLAFAGDPQNNRNYINIVQQPGGQFFTGGTDPVTTIDLESHLNANGSFSAAATISGDWLGKYLIKNGGNEIPSSQAAALIKRFPLGTFTSGGPSQSLSASYKLDNYGKLARK